MSQKYFSTVENRIIPEWKEFYVDVHSLKEIISGINIFEDKLKENQDLEMQFSTHQNHFIHYLSSLFWQEMLSELYKFNWFFKYLFNNKLKLNLANFQMNLDMVILAKTEKLKGQYNKLRTEILNPFEKMFMESCFLRSFLNTNFEMFDLMIYEYRKLFWRFKKNDLSLAKSFNEKLKLSFAYKKKRLLDSIINYQRSMYTDNISMLSYDRSEAHLDAIANRRQFTYDEIKVLHFMFGGFVVCCIVILFDLGIVGYFTYDNHVFVLKVYQIFRGSLVCFLYCLFLGMQVYFWEKYHINYKKIFGVEFKTSSSFQIMKRAFIFLLIWGLIFLYNIETFFQGDSSAVLNPYAAGILACCIYFIFILYLICPIPGIFNFSGRMFMWKVGLDIVISPFQKKITFLTIWCTDQLTSFPLFLRDLVYTLCFFPNLLANNGDINKITCSTTVPLIVFDTLVLLVPLIYRVLQCLNLGINIPKDRTMHLKNMAKFMTMVNTNIWAVVFARGVGWAEYVWWASVIVSTICFYLWDIFYDFGFFQKNAKHRFLRDELAYPGTWFYYAAIPLDLVFRAAWVLQLTPIGVFSSPLTKNSILTTAGVIEAFRRTLWNYFKIEMQHLNMSGNFTLLPDINWRSQYNMPADKMKVEKEFQKILSTPYKEETIEVDVSKDDNSKAPLFYDLNYSVNEKEIKDVRKLYLNKKEVIREKMINDKKILSSIKMSSFVETNKEFTRLSNFRIHSYPELLNFDSDSVIQNDSLYEENEHAILKNDSVLSEILKQDNLATNPSQVIDMRTNAKGDKINLIITPGEISNKTNESGKQASPSPQLNSPDNEKGRILSPRISNMPPDTSISNFATFESRFKKG